VQAQIGIWTILAGIAAAVAAAEVVAAVAEAYSSGSRVAIADGMTGWEASVDAAGRAFGMRKPYWDCKVLVECSTMSFCSGFALDPLPEWISRVKRGL
jgi:hypothetical protein